MEQLPFLVETAPGAAPAPGVPPARAETEPKPEIVTGYELERELAAAGMPVVAGVDEVGRGAWAGPVMVCAAVVRPGYPDPPPFLTDSKKLTAKRREALAAVLAGWVEDHAVGAATHEEIDALGMTAALCTAAVRALERLKPGTGKSGAGRLAADGAGTDDGQLSLL